MRKLFSLCLFLMVAIPLWATHQRAAEITYSWKGANAYEFTLITYNVPNTAWQQRDSLLVSWGGNAIHSVISAIHHELDAFGNGAELPDNQFVSYEVVEMSNVLFKQVRSIHVIIVSIVSNDDTRILHHILDEA